MKEVRRELDLYLSHRAALIDYAAPIVGDRARAEDVVQEAWLRFTGDTVGQRTSIVQPVSYLYRVVRNLAIDFTRRLAPEVRGEEADGFLDFAPATSPDPESCALHRDELNVVLAALEELPERTRRAFHMHRFDDRTYSEIALALGISQGRAHNLVSDAVAHCTQRIMDGSL